MAFSELESKRYEKAVKAFIDSRRPPPEIRPELDLGYRMSGQSVEIFEIRQAWDDPSEKGRTRSRRRLIFCDRTCGGSTSSGPILSGIGTIRFLESPELNHAGNPGDSFS